MSTSTVPLLLVRGQRSGGGRSCVVNVTLWWLGKCRPPRQRECNDCSEGGVKKNKSRRGEGAVGKSGESMLLVWALEKSHLNKMSALYERTGRFNLNPPTATFNLDSVRLKNWTGLIFDVYLTEGGTWKCSRPPVFSGDPLPFGSLDSSTSVKADCVIKIKQTWSHEDGACF